MSDEEKEEDAINLSDETEADLSHLTLIESDEKEADLTLIESDEKEEDLQKKKEAKSTQAVTDLQRAELISRLLTPQMPA